MHPYKALSLAIASLLLAPAAHSSETVKSDLITFKNARAPTTPAGKGLMYPTLSLNFKNDVVRKKVNDQMEQIAATMRKDDDDIAKGESTIRTFLINDSIWSFAIDIERDGYVMMDSQHYAFNLRTGATMTFDQQLSKTGKAAFKKFLLKEVVKQIPKDADPDCTQVNYQYFKGKKAENHLSVFEPTITDKGVSFSQNDLPQATRACGIGLTLSYAQLKPFLNPDSLLIGLAR